MSVQSLRTPSYRLHKSAGQAVVTLCCRDLYLGKYGTRESRAEYDRTVAEWLANGRTLPRPISGKPADVTSNELLDAFLDWAESYHVKNGRMTGEVAHVRYSIKRSASFTGSNWLGKSVLFNSRRFARQSSIQGSAELRLIGGSGSSSVVTGGPWRKG